MKPPIYGLLMKYASNQKIKFSSPGHKGKIRMKTDNLCRIDIQSTDYDLNAAIVKSEEEMAGIFGSSKSFYLTSGAAAGIYAALASICSPGDKVIVDPECDRAVINAITILALQPVFLKRSYCSKYSINGGISAAEAEYSIGECSDAKLIILTSPTYYGVCANIKRIVDIAHRHSIPVMVDESYGVHMNFITSAPQSALDCGADITVQDLSKTLGGFTGSGMLHLAQSINPVLADTIESNLDIYQGSGKSTAMLCATENILLYAFSNSGKYHSLYKEIERGKEIISCKTGILWFDAEYNNGADINITDKTRIVLNFSKYTSPADEVADILYTKYGIEADYFDEDNIVFSVSLYNTASEIRKLVNSCLNISRLLTPVNNTDEEDSSLELFDEGPKAVMSPYKAFYCSGEWVEPDMAVGKICRKPIYKVPSGTPIIIPGEKISIAQIEAIKELKAHKAKIHGLNEIGQIEVLSLSDSFYF